METKRILYGYGKILDVDLSTGKIVKRDIDPQFAREFIGGMGFSSKILYDEVGPDVAPLSPDNIVIFATGPLTGTHAPCAGRTEITTKSPLTGSIGTGNTGGVWGAMLKHAGFALIVVRNRAEKPVYLSINDDRVEIRAASHLWGKDTKVTSDIIRQELGSSFSVLAIGIAGENLVSYACPLNDYHHVAARAGAGAVMGAKKLKAIAVHGTGVVNIARPEEFQEAVKKARDRLAEADRAGSSDGATTWSARPSTWKEAGDDYLRRGCLPAKNYQTGVLPLWQETRGLDIRRKYITKKEGTCYACPMSCFNLAEVNEGKYAGTKVSRATHTGIVLDFGAKCAIADMLAIWKCKELCQHLGMDYVSTAGCIAFAMELFQRGIITIKDTDGLDLSWGNEDSVIRMIQKIALREGFGNVLAEGSVRAAKIIGKGAEQFVMTMKGMELLTHDPRSGKRGWTFGVMTNPRGGDNVKGPHCLAERYNPDWWIDKFDMFENVKEKIYSGVSPEEVSSTWKGKPTYCKWFEDLFSLNNALGLCFFVSSLRIALGPTYLSRLFSTCTGWETTPQDFMKLGEKIFTMLKAYTVRQGLTRKDDDWPDRFYIEPLPEGPAKGAVLSRDLMGQLLDEYYELRGWDKRTGVPTREKLIDLGLHNLSSLLQFSA